MSNSIKFTVALIFSVGLFQCVSSSSPNSRIFNYVDDLPVKAESKAESTTENGLPPTESGQISEAEQKCWDTINELSKVIFSKQQVVLDDLEKDLLTLNATDDFKSMVKMTVDLLRSNMDFALKSLEEGKADDYFDALFDSSDNIISLSTMLRNPKLDDEAFFVLVKAVSRLGRNNSSLVQELASVCASRKMTRPKNTKLRPATDFLVKDN